MDFFQRQDNARRKSALLVVYFLFAVICISLSMYLAACLISPVLKNAIDSSETSHYPLPSSRVDRSGDVAQGHEFSFWQPHLLLLVGGGTLLVIGLGSLYKIVELRGGGATIATMLGGRLIQPNTTDPDERRLLNVVQEMALASGTNVPPVYILDDEKGINAFAAGYSPADAVIGVNRGTVNYLSRDELQGVIAHEFSHILNGDMRTNIHFMGVLHGILLIAVIGFYAIRFGGLSGGSRNSKNNSALYFVLLGVAALIIGAIGLFFARLIKATLSRQREYLADASAVQFTRNPDGIAGALKQIGGLALGSRMTAADAESASHMFFGNARRESSLINFSTHPPLAERIRRIEPAFDGKFSKAKRYREKPGDSKSSAKRTAARGGNSTGSLRPAKEILDGRFPLTAAVVLGAIGEPSQQHVAQSGSLLASLPESVRNAVEEPFTARSTIYALLLDSDPNIQKNQLAIIEKHEDAHTAKLSVDLFGQLKTLDEEYRLSLVELAHSALSHLSPDQYRNFRQVVSSLVEADQQISLFEFMLQRVVLERLDRQLLGTKPPANKYRSIAPLKKTICQLISVLAHAGSDEDSIANGAYDNSLRLLFPSGELPKMLDRDDCTLHLVDTVLDKLAQSSPAIKKRLLETAIACVASDGQVTLAEAELVRAIAASLDCPLPPLSPGPIGSG